MKASEDAQMLRDSRVADPQNCREIACAQLLAQKDVDDACPRRITQGPAERSEIDIGLTAQKEGARARDILRLDAADLADI